MQNFYYREKQQNGSWESPTGFWLFNSVSSDTALERPEIFNIANALFKDTVPFYLL